MNDLRKGKDFGGIIMVDDSGEEHKYPFVLSPIEELPDDIYSNHVIVNHTPHEFNIYFNRITTPLSAEQIPKDKKIKMKTVAKIVIAPSLMEQLINTLKINLENFKKGIPADEPNSK